MNLLITGATGFLGSHLTRAFLGEGHRVVALKRATSSLIRLAEVADKVAFYDLEGLDLQATVSREAPIDAVIHTATCYGRRGESAVEVFEANTTFPLRLLAAAGRHGVGVFLNADTVLPRDVNAYALSKFQFVEWGKRLSQDQHIRFVNLRLEHLYGPGDDASKFTTWIVKSCLANVPEIKLTAGEQQRDFIHIADAVSAFKVILEHVFAFNPGFTELGIGTGEPVSVRNFVEVTHRLCRSRSNLAFGALPYRENELMECGTNLRSLLSWGWRSQIPLEVGVAEMLREMMR